VLREWGWGEDPLGLFKGAGGGDSRHYGPNGKRKRKGTLGEVAKVLTMNKGASSILKRWGEDIFGSKGRKVKKKCHRVVTRLPALGKEKPIGIPSVSAAKKKKAWC